MTTLVFDEEEAGLNSEHDQGASVFTVICDDSWNESGTGMATGSLLRSSKIEKYFVAARSEQRSYRIGISQWIRAQGSYNDFVTQLIDYVSDNKSESVLVPAIDLLVAIGPAAAPFIKERLLHSSAYIENAPGEKNPQLLKGGRILFVLAASAARIDSRVAEELLYAKDIVVREAALDSLITHDDEFAMRAIERLLKTDLPAHLRKRAEMLLAEI